MDYKKSGSEVNLGKPRKPIPRVPVQTTISDLYVTISGTSMATLMVAGTTALWLIQNPTWRYSS